MLTYRNLCLPVFLTITVFSQNSDIETTINKYNSYLEASLIQIETDYKNQLSQASQQYLQNLTSIEIKYQQQGNLDNLLKIRQEKIRFEMTRSITEKDIEGNPPELGIYQKNYLASIKTAETQKYKNIISAFEKYLQTMESLTKFLTQEGKIEEAIKVKKAIEKAQSDPIFIEAKKNIEAGTSIQTNKKEELSQPAIGKPISDPDVTVYTEGNKPPTISGRTYTPSTLYASSLAKTTHPLTASLFTYVDRSSSKKSGIFYSSGSYNESYYLRINFRPKNTACVLTNLCIVIHYISKKSITSKSHLVPVYKKVAIVPVINYSGIWLDIDKKEFEKENVRVWRESYSAGNEFYGVIITAVSIKEELLYQSISTPGLDEFSLQALEDAKRTVRSFYSTISPPAKKDDVRSKEENLNQCLSEISE